MRNRWCESSRTLVFLARQFWQAAGTCCRFTLETESSRVSRKPSPSGLSICTLPRFGMRLRHSDRYVTI